MSKKNTVTLEGIESLIVKEEYQKMGKKMTICLLTLSNGHEVVGTAGCVDHRNYDLEIGSKYAREDAIEKIWPLEGYALQKELHEKGEL